MTPTNAPNTDLFKTGIAAVIALPTALTFALLLDRSPLGIFVGLWVGTLVGVMVASSIETG